MADVSITAANVVAQAGARVVNGLISGDTITAGQVCYRDAEDSKIKLADTTSADKATAYGIALNSAYPGQPISVLTSGPITVGETLTAGSIYTVSDNAGGLRDSSENGSGDYVTVVGVATSTSTLVVGINATGAALSS